MKRYVVIVPKGEIEPPLLTKVFPHFYELVAETVWIVGSPQITCAEVCETLGIGRDGKRGVVTKMDDYYGFYDRALWEKANAWGAQT